jgi:hypothetical protein
MYPSKEYFESIKKKLEEMNLAEGRPASPGDVKKQQMDLDQMDFFGALGSSAIKWMEKNNKNSQ